MRFKGFDLFISEPDSTARRFCRVCDSHCSVTRNVYGPTGFVSAMAGQFRMHDEFVCPHSDEPWHGRALKLAIEVDKTPSKRLATLMREDLEDLLHENLL